MRVSQELIAGISPAKLKALFKKEDFDTPMAMRVLGLWEPDASRKMSELAEGGWIRFLGTRSHVDRWEVAKRGRRLLATKIVKRISRERGLEILERAIATAREINADPNRANRVASIMLFGSMLDPEAADVGDVDIALVLGRRKLSREAYQRIVEHEDALAPANIRRTMAIYGWPETRIERELRGIAKHVSIHPTHDIDATGAAYRIVYAFDPKAERELPVDGKIVAARPPQKDFEQDVERNGPAVPTQESRAVTNPVDWPTDIGRSTLVEVDMEAECLAQHMWGNGAPLDAIARRTRRPASMLRSYFAWQANGPRQIVAPAFDLNIEHMIGRVIEGCGRKPIISATIRLDHGKQSIRLLFRDGRDTAEIWDYAQDRNLSARTDDLRRLSEGVHAAMVAWMDRVRSRMVGLDLQADIVIVPDSLVELPPFSGKVVPNFRGLVDPMRSLLAERVISRGEAPYLYRVCCSLAGGGIATAVQHQKRDWKTISRARSECRDIDKKAEALLGPDRAWLDSFTRFEIARGALRDDPLLKPHYDAWWTANGLGGRDEDE